MDIRKTYLDGSIMIRHKIFGKLVGIGPRSKFSLLLSWVVAGCSCVSHRLLLISALGGCPELLEELLSELELLEELLAGAAGCYSPGCWWFLTGGCAWWLLDRKGERAKGGEAKRRKRERERRRRRGTERSSCQLLGACWPEEKWGRERGGGCLRERERKRIELDLLFRVWGENG